MNLNIKYLNIFTVKSIVSHELVSETRKWQQKNLGYFGTFAAGFVGTALSGNWRHLCVNVENNVSFLLSGITTIACQCCHLASI